ncbi:helix-turn-helix transcriptional regulator [Thalassospira sp. HF15]|uniref:helix-turn-helix domain-containing protein n=1 Tax=Thalassospira sp. HF15 TaxID=2722755 RepID=UPI00143109BD|nr:AraC family transcriptional regulator [Thalassospira sp. HF15]NIY76840.1 helix-turn-helix transcriptional regulator [Thalassospira sp. HF15]
MQETGQSTDEVFDMFSDQEGEGGIGELRLADGDLFELPGASGRLERIDFGNGICLHRAELNVREDSRFDVQNALPPGWFCGFVNLLGCLDLKCPKGLHHRMSPETGFAMRIDQPGTRFFMPKGQLIRHVGVTIELEALYQRFDNEVPDGLEPFFTDEQDLVEIRPLPINHKIRRLVSTMFSPQVTGPGRKLRLEGLSALFLTEVIDAYCQRNLEVETTLAPTVLEQTLIAETIAKITAQLAQPLSVLQLADDAGMAETRLNNLMKHETGKTCAEFIRTERMARARALLASGEATVKQVATEVGFNHVSNFSRSYRDWYGESPAQALKRNNA